MNDHFTNTNNPIDFPKTDETVMNERIKKLVVESELIHIIDDAYVEKEIWQPFVGRFVELIKQSIWDDVKEELLEDEIINIETDPFVREYLKGCNGGTVDALYRIKQFGVDE